MRNTNDFGLLKFTFCILIGCSLGCETTSTHEVTCNPYNPDHAHGVWCEKELIAQENLAENLCPIKVEGLDPKNQPSVTIMAEWGDPLPNGKQPYSYLMPIGLMKDIVLLPTPSRCKVGQKAMITF